MNYGFKMNDYKLNQMINSLVDFNATVDDLEKNFKNGSLTRPDIDRVNLIADNFTEIVCSSDLPDNPILQDVCKEAFIRYETLQNIKRLFNDSVLGIPTETADVASNMDNHSLTIVEGSNTEFRQILNTLTEEDLSILRKGLWLRPANVYNLKPFGKKDERDLYDVLNKCGILFQQNSGQCGLNHCDCHYSKDFAEKFGSNMVDMSQRGMNKALACIFQNSVSFNGQRKVTKVEELWIERHIPKGPIQVCSLGAGGCLIDLIFISFLKEYGYGPIEYVVSDIEYNNFEEQAPGALAAITDKLYDDVTIKACKDFKEIPKNSEFKQLVVAFDADWIEASKDIANSISSQFKEAPRFYFVRNKGFRFNPENSTNIPNDTL